MRMVPSMEGTHVCLLPHFPHTVRKVCTGTMSRSKMHFKRHSMLLKLNIQHRQNISLVAPKQSNFRASHSVLSQETIRIQPCPRFPLSPLSTVRDPQEAKEVRNRVFNPSFSWPLTRWLPNSSLSHPCCRNTSVSSSVQWRGLNKRLISKLWCVDWWYQIHWIHKSEFLSMVPPESTFLENIQVVLKNNTFERHWVTWTLNFQSIQNTGIQHALQ